MAEVLVAYATKMGSTKEIAEAIGERIRAAGHSVTVLPAGEVRSLDRYSAVVLGSALYATRWRGDAVKLLKRLSGKKVWLFHSGPLGKDLSPQKAPAKVRRLAARVGTEAPTTFPGRLEAKTAKGFIARKMAQGEMAGDYRDWDAINAWADQIAAHVTG
ncbi:flavodoxin [Lentzea sp. NBRC 105346]|uniref:flavodoxin domain-containing protein n=1 Tax=Lentzea sp. NBRC 105346 TaxID=3032205 RepID=UPI0024A3E79B|nr:flavodoxin domain-containing protein [Lentzea sp. NBRC 105346]GLZ27821.1 flavodoxin [Lentzea sp. NBRC 105346]